MVSEWTGFYDSFIGIIMTTRTLILLDGNVIHKDDTTATSDPLEWVIFRSLSLYAGPLSYQILFAALRVFEDGKGKKKKKTKEGEKKLCIDRVRRCTDLSIDRIDFDGTA